MNTAMNQLMSTACQMSVETVKEFVEYAKTNGVEFPDDLLENFLAQMQVPTTAKRSRGPSRSPSSSFLLYRQEKNDEIVATLCDPDSRQELLQKFADDESQADKVDAIAEWGEEYDDDNSKAITAQNKVRVAALMWALESSEVQEAYKREANRVNEEFQRQNPDDRPVPPKAKRTPRKSAEPESLSNYRNVDFTRYETDEDYDGHSCATWLKRGKKYCSRPKKAGNEDFYCKRHGELFEEAKQILGDTEDEEI